MRLCCFGFFCSTAVRTSVQFPHFLILHKYFFNFLSTGAWSQFSCSVIWFSTFMSAFFKSISSHFFSSISLLLAKQLSSRNIVVPCGRSNDTTTAGPKYSYKGITTSWRKWITLTENSVGIIFRSGRTSGFGESQSLPFHTVKAAKVCHEVYLGILTTAEYVGKGIHQSYDKQLQNCKQMWTNYYHPSYMKPVILSSVLLLRGGHLQALGRALLGDSVLKISIF